MLVSGTERPPEMVVLAAFVISRLINLTHVLRVHARAQDPQRASSMETGFVDRTCNFISMAPWSHNHLSLPNMFGEVCSLESLEFRRLTFNLSQKVE